MLVPPKDDDWSARIDPTKLKNRKFNSGKGAKAPPAKGARGCDISALWTETPEQKRQRLEDEMMGVKKPAQLVDGEEGRMGRGKEEKSRETERRIMEFNVCVLSRPLFETVVGIIWSLLTRMGCRRRKIEVVRFTISIRKRYQRRRKTIRVKGRSTRRRT